MDVSRQLKERGLKATTSRLGVMEMLGETGMAYSHAELESLFDKMDRVTLYRVLKDFEDAGLVHRVIDMQGITRYGVCGHTCPEEHHIDEHVHFNCQSCHKVFCLEKVASPLIKVPSGFKASGRHTLIYGLCKDCSVA